MPVSIIPSNLPAGLIRAALEFELETGWELSADDMAVIAIGWEMVRAGLAREFAESVVCGRI